jgi:NAD(P)-dependent dehydrogenase (short-subunit alcohol dehydrogenase family)
MMKKILGIYMMVILLLVGCSPNEQQNSIDNEQNNQSGTIGDANSNVDASGDGVRFGATSYNTPEVADEMRYIEENIKPSEGPKKRILVTGSTGGLGELTAYYLAKRGHTVVAHARSEARAADVRRDIPEISNVVIGDLNDLDQTRQLAEDINALGTFDVIIHNAGVYGEPSEEMLHVNSLSPYILTSLVNRPKQLIYLTSDQHLSGDIDADDITSDNPRTTYSDTKTHIFALAMAVAREWPEIQSNAVQPGWVPTLMGFANGNTTTPDNLREGYMTQVWLAEGIEPGSKVTGEYFFHQEIDRNFNPIVRDVAAQNRMLDAFAQKTGVSFPRD